MVRDHSGFEYVPERPDAENFMKQKWGWRATEPGKSVKTHVLPAHARLPAPDSPVLGSLRACPSPYPCPNIACSAFAMHRVGCPACPCPHAGSWAELEVDSRASDGSKSSNTYVWLSHLRRQVGRPPESQPLIRLRQVSSQAWGVHGSSRTLAQCWASPPAVQLPGHGHGAN